MPSNKDANQVLQYAFDDVTETLQVSISQSELPSGAATAANQIIGNASLSSIDGKLNSLGQKPMTTSMPVVIASNQSPVPVNLAAPTAGTITQAAVTVGTSAIRATVSGSAPSSTRKVLTITIDPTSSARFYIGSNSVTSSGSTRGLMMTAGQSVAFSNDAGDYYIISDTAGQTVFIMEQS